MNLTTFLDRLKERWPNPHNWIDPRVQAICEIIHDLTSEQRESLFKHCQDYKSEHPPTRAQYLAWTDMIKRTTTASVESAQGDASLPPSVALEKFSKVRWSDCNGLKDYLKSIGCDSAVEAMEKKKGEI
jgi:hypothetical protein